MVGVAQCSPQSIVVGMDCAGSWWSDLAHHMHLWLVNVNANGDNQVESAGTYSGNH